MKRGLVQSALAAGAALLLVASVATAAPKYHDPLVGDWELDAASSKLVGRPSMNSAHLSVTAAKDGSKVVLDATYESGPAVHYEYTIAGSGESFAVAGNTYFDSATVVVVDKHTTIRTERRGGKVVGVTTVEIAKDGKSFHGSSKGVLPDGTRFTGTSSWNRAKKKK